MMKSFLVFLVLIFFLSNNMVFAAFLDEPILNKAQFVSQSRDKVSVDQQVMIVCDLSNGQDKDQRFAYIVQIRDENDVVTSLTWLTGSLAPRQTFSPALSWTPTVPGTYSIQIFVWESLNNPDALSPPLSLTVEVVNI